MSSGHTEQQNMALIIGRRLETRSDQLIMLMRQKV